jgi:feruloyl esterase
VCAVLFAAVMHGQAFAAGSPCESLSSLTLPDTTITLVQSVPKEGFTGAGSGRAASQGFNTLPSFCRVAATMRPTSDSDIKIEIWLPTSSWNGKFQAVGNGGWAGSISYPAMAEALRVPTRTWRDIKAPGASMTLRTFRATRP